MVINYETPLIRFASRAHTQKLVHNATFVIEISSIGHFPISPKSIGGGYVTDLNGPARSQK
jgi:hypothetical protein